MSGSIFGDDDDFELVGGSDTPSAIRKPPAARPVAPRTPSAATSASGENKPTGNQPSASAPAPSALPRPQLPLPTGKEVAPTRRTLPKNPDTIKTTPKPTEERVETPKLPTPPVREVSRRDTTQVEPKVVPPVAPVETRESIDRSYREEEIPTTQGRYDETDRSVSNTVPNSRRTARINSTDYDSFPSNEDRNTRPSTAREENPQTLYSQTPYVPAETSRPEPSRVAQPIQSYPEVHSTPPAPQTPQQSAKAPAKNTRPTKSKKTKADNVDKTKGPSAFSGGRAGVIVVRVFAIAVVAILMLTGAKSIFFPPQIPDPTTVTNVVKKRLGVTNFPTENGQAFVTSFARIYFTVDPSNTNTNDAYAPYMSSSLASSMTSSSGADSKQTITEGPIVSGVKSVDDANAVYTVGAKLSTGNWMYVDIPVYYDKDSVGFAVSGMPAFAPAPTKITVPPAESPFAPDTKLADSIKSSVMEQFFPAWAASNTAGINLVVLKEANPEAKIGLANSVKYVSIQSFAVELKQPGDADENTRKAQATVKWASAADPKITYTQQYNMVLFEQPDHRWYIKEMTSGVRS